jgi:hypothetical protein
VTAAVSICTFPLLKSKNHGRIAQVVSTLLAQAGFKLTPGQLESFPNPRPYTVGTPSLYNGHRVPLQAGSYLLNAHWEAVYSDQAAFVQQWRWAERRNDLDHKTIKRVLKQTQRQQYKVVKGGGQKLLNDLHTEIEQGWTGLVKPIGCSVGLPCVNISLATSYVVVHP